MGLSLLVWNKNAQSYNAGLPSGRLRCSVCNWSRAVMTFWSLWRPVISLLVARLPSQLILWAVKHVAHFVETTLLTASEELAHICKELTRQSPQDVIKYILQPLLTRLETDYMGSILQMSSEGKMPQLTKVINYSCQPSPLLGVWDTSVAAAHPKFWSLRPSFKLVPDS